MTAEQEVKKVYPKAKAHYNQHPRRIGGTSLKYYRWRILQSPLSGRRCSGHCRTEREAWADALRRIKEGKKP